MGWPELSKRYLRTADLALVRSTFNLLSMFTSLPYIHTTENNHGMARTLKTLLEDS
jgi:hypothetical protein